MGYLDSSIQIRHSLPQPLTQVAGAEKQKLDPEIAAIADEIMGFIESMSSNPLPENTNRTIVSTVEGKTVEKANTVATGKLRDSKTKKEKAVKESSQETLLMMKENDKLVQAKLLSKTPGKTRSSSRRTKSDPTSAELQQLRLMSKMGIGEPKVLIDTLQKKDASKIANLQSSLVSLNTRLFDGGVGKIKGPDIGQMSKDLEQQQGNVRLAITKAVLNGHAKSDHVESLKKLDESFAKLATIFSVLGSKEEYEKLTPEKKTEYKAQLEALRNEVQANEKLLPPQPVELKSASMITRLSCTKLLNTMK
jgi:hypothetical protein